MLSERLLFRKINENDQAFIFRGLSDPEVIRYYGIYYTTYEETKIQMDWYAENESSGIGDYFLICSKPDFEEIGVCGLYHISSQYRKAEIGYWLIPNFQGKGYMTEVLQTLLPYWQKKFNLHRIEAEIEPPNVASKKLLLKNGFELEGRKKDAEIKNGEFISLDFYARILD